MHTVSRTAEFRVWGACSQSFIPYDKTIPITHENNVPNIV